MNYDVYHVERAVKALSSVLPCMDDRETIVCIAEHLIEQGVIFPELKVGDFVYRPENGTVSKERVGAVNVEYTIDKGTGIGDVWWLKEYNVGVTTFKTETEANECIPKEE